MKGGEPGCNLWAQGYTVSMITKAAAADSKTEWDAKYIAEMDECLAEIAIIRRDMKKTDAEIRRLDLSTRRTLGHIRGNLH